MNKKMIYPLISAGIFIADIQIKRLADRKLENNREVRLFKGSVLLKLFRNRGAMLNSFDDRPEHVRRLSLSLCAALGIIYIACLITGRGDRYLFALSLLLGGACSNTCDRYARGYVVDYISFPAAGKAASRVLGKKAGRYIGGIVYNISDFFIFIGAFITIVRLNSTPM